MDALTARAIIQPMSKPTDISIEPGAALSLRQAARYCGIDYARFRWLCRRGEIETAVKFPGSKRVITTRQWCDEARQRWSSTDGKTPTRRSTRPAVTPLAAGPVLRPETGKALLDWCFK